MRQPGLYHIDYLSDYEEKTRLENGLWCKKRPQQPKGFWRRLKAALMVLIGKADAVVWTEQ